MAIPGESVEEIRDRHALLCESFSLLLDRIDPEGGVEELDTHLVVARDLELLGQRITTVGVGLRDASVVRAHAAGVITLAPEERQRAAVLYTIAELLEDVYADSGECARAGLRGAGIKFEDGSETSPLELIADSPDGRSPHLLKWMGKMLPLVIGDPYYHQFYE